MAKLDRRHILTGMSGLLANALCPSIAWSAAAQLSPAAMRSDISVLVDAYTTLHPGLYHYLTPAAFERECQRLARFGSTSRSLGEFYLALTAFTASIRCGHSFPNPANQPAAITSALFGKPDRLPLAFEWLKDRMIVTADLGSGRALPAGSEILAIDGTEARTMLATMLPYARTDGGNDARKAADLGVSSDAGQQTFDVLRTLLFPSAGTSAQIMVRANGNAVSFACPLVSATARDAGLRPSAKRSPYGWTFEQRGAAGILTMPTWAVFHNDWDWRSFIEGSIDSAIDRKLAGIVIDLRDNAGGLDCGAVILARLIAAPLAADGYSRHVRYRQIPSRLSPYLSTWDPKFRDWGTSAAGPDAQGFYALSRVEDASDIDIIQPAGRRFGGKLVVLTGPKNASATFGFANLVQRHRLGTLIGEPTGGNRRGINGGAFFFVGLPASKIEVDLPLIAYWPDTPQPDAGVTPDILVSPRAADLRRGRDTALERSLLEAST